MSSRTFVLTILCALVLMVPLIAVADDPPEPAVQGNEIQLLEPIDGISRINIDNNGGGLGVFNAYFGMIYPWIIGMAGGIVMFNAVIGGIQMIQAGGNAEGVTKGKDRLLYSLGGLLLLLLASTIMHTLNASFYVGPPG